MDGWKPQQYDPYAHQQRLSGSQRQAPEPWSWPDHRYQVPQQRQYDQRGVQSQPYAQAIRKTCLTAAEKFWYVVGNIAFGAAYFAKIPAKKALSDFGLAELTSAEEFWYVLMCIAFGAGYFAKIPTAKAISELERFRLAGPAIGRAGW